MNISRLCQVGANLFAALFKDPASDELVGNSAREADKPERPTLETTQATPPAELHWEIVDQSGARTRDSGIYLDCTGIRFSATFVAGHVNCRYQIHLYRPDGTLFRELVMTTAGDGHARANLAGCQVRAMLRTPGTWLALLADPLSEKPIARHLVDVIDLTTAILSWRPTLTIGVEEGRGTVDTISTDSAALRLQVSLNPGGQVPLSRYRGLEAALSGTREGGETSVEILRWPLSGDSDRWLFALAYPLAVLGISAAITTFLGAIDTNSAGWNKTAISVGRMSSTAVLMLMITEEGFFHVWSWRA